jgi:muramoyltetrapeptide carboxypeptidase
MTKHISLIAPSYSFPKEEAELSQNYLENLGMKVSMPMDLLGEDLLCANQDDRRLFHLQNALEDASVDIIWMLGGGYGLTRLMPNLLSMKKPDKEKLFIGFSDGTALHTFLNQSWNWTTLHGTGARQVALKRVGAQTIEATLRMVREGLETHYPYPLKPLNEKAQKFGPLSGSVAGGNLCLLACSLGTPWQVNPSGKILFLEDVFERGYSIDRMLVHLKQAGVFENVKALILGDFTGGQEEDGRSLVWPVLDRFANTNEMPIFHLPGCGHGDENFPLPFNVNLNFSII